MSPVTGETGHLVPSGTNKKTPWLLVVKATDPYDR
jgi:hypothetical protein